MCVIINLLDGQPMLCWGLLLCLLDGLSQNHVAYILSLQLTYFLFLNFSLRKFYTEDCSNVSV